jgi:hypothetical protein
MEAGVHLPQMEFAGEGLSLRRLADTVDAAHATGFAAVSVNDHFLFGAPWPDGLTALAAVAERSAPNRPRRTGRSVSGYTRGLTARTMGAGGFSFLMRYRRSKAGLLPRHPATRWSGLGK